MESIWSRETDIPGRKSLQAHIDADVAVIGAGMAGILTAYLLKQQGKNVVVLEADRIGSGQTKNTTAKITSQHNLIYSRLQQEFGPEKAGQYARANEKAVAEYRRLIAERSIDCRFEERPAYLYSTEDTAPLEREAKAAATLGIRAEFTKDTALPFAVRGSVKFEGQAQFQPLKFLAALAEELEIYENTVATSVEQHQVFSEEGSVSAPHIVMATHFPFINTPGYYFMRMHQERSYVLALEGAKPLNGMYLSVDRDSYSFRDSGPLVLLGGSGHRTGENSAGGHYDQLVRAAAEFYPESREVARWSAQDCMTLDGIPYIGRFSPQMKGVYVATGFGKWGMTSSMVSAMILTNLILGRRSPYAGVFSPRRFQLSASAKTLVEDGLKSFKGLAAQYIDMPEDKLEELPRGQGGIVEYRGKQTAAYVDDTGKPFRLSPKCSHLGCRVEWNPDEHTWDCPCHGSRFDHTGVVLDGPALEGLPDA